MGEFADFVNKKDAEKTGDIPAGRILPEVDVVVSRRKMGELIRQALGFASVCWEPMDATGIFQEDKVNRVADELMEAVEKFAWAQGLLERDPVEKIELPGQKIPLVTHSAGGRQVIGHAQLFGDVILARIPLAALELGVARTLKADGAKGISLRKPEIVFKPPQMVTGVMFPTDLKFQITSNGEDS